MGDYEKALADYNYVLSVEPKNIEVYELRVEAYKQLAEKEKREPQKEEYRSKMLLDQEKIKILKLESDNSQVPVEASDSIEKGGEIRYDAD
jgi:Tfp pilus assembly protein PilF